MLTLWRTLEAIVRKKKENWQRSISCYRCQELLSFFNTVPPAPKGGLESRKPKTGSTVLYVEMEAEEVCMNLEWWSIGCLFIQEWQNGWKNQTYISKRAGKEKEGLHNDIMGGIVTHLEHDSPITAGCDVILQRLFEVSNFRSSFLPLWLYSNAEHYMVTANNNP